MSQGLRSLPCDPCGVRLMVAFCDALPQVQTSLQAAETRLSLLEAQLASAASDTDAQADAGRPVADQASAAPTASPTASAEAALADDGAGAAFEQEQDQHETLPREGWEVVLQQVSQTAQRTTPTLAH